MASSLSLSFQLKIRDQLSRLPFVGYFYGEGPERCYAFFSESRIVDYETGIADRNLRKATRLGPRAGTEIDEDLRKDAKDRWRGAAFVEDNIIPSFGVSHDLIEGSSLEPQMLLSHSGVINSPQLRGPAEIFRSFGSYHIIKTTVYSGNETTTGLSLRSGDTPKELLRSLRGVFSSFSPQLWYFEAGKKPYGIETGDSLLTHEDGQWSLGTPDDFKGKLRTPVSTIYILRKSPSRDAESKEDQVEAHGPRPHDEESLQEMSSNPRAAVRRKQNREADTDRSRKRRRREAVSRVTRQRSGGINSSSVQPRFVDLPSEQADLHNVLMDVSRTLSRLVEYNEAIMETLNSTRSRLDTLSTAIMSLHDLEQDNTNMNAGDKGGRLGRSSLAKDLSTE